ncbi:short-chain dehydrogenase [Streptomyces mashuensis]|uniref:Short-chain dehydrogenase n=1 Tax=Streptomyces mashuensis TaxID=33904 RepID=A0A919EFW1_9ACTN|nr:SDR family oxidoreductase [Streptomyces mashuensis]GHF69242.1 short-chain dehydrogenase [Streptomyces mashuensis]
MGFHRTALVTGANRGIGLATARALLGAGWRVVLTARDGAAARAAATALGPGARGLALDVTCPEGVAAAREAAGPVDGLVSNAGVLLDAGHDVLTVPLETVRATLEVNVLGAWRVCQTFVPGMVAAGWGRVVLLSSGTGTFGAGLHPGTPAYSLSKTAVNALTTLLAARTRGTGVLVNAVNPGRTRTRMLPGGERSPQEAAADVLHALALPDDGPTGVLLRHGRPTAW